MSQRPPEQTPYVRVQGPMPGGADPKSSIAGPPGTMDPPVPSMSGALPPLTLSHDPPLPPRPGSRIEAQMAGPGFNGGRPYMPPTAYGSGPEQLDSPPLVVQAAHDMPTVRISCQFALQEYLSLQEKQRRGSSRELDERFRVQSNLLLGDLHTLQDQLLGIAHSAEGHRWRRWLVGGAIASFIPIVKRIFRRSSSSQDQSLQSKPVNDTEHAFNRSSSLLSRIQESVLGSHHWASVTFFVFAVLYVFQNEVLLRVARTVHRRLKKLSAKVEEGGADIEEKDLKLLEGWRWRVLLWKKK